MIDSMKSSLHKIQCFFLLVLMIPLLMLTAWAEDPGAKLKEILINGCSPAEGGGTPD